MTTDMLTGSARVTPTGRGGRARRVASLARAEALLLRRNPLALVNALVVPAALVLFVRSGLPAGGGSRGAGAGIVTSLTAFTLLSVVYYSLVTALVARREELVLKRLRTGEIGDAEILAGTAAPAIAIAWAQILIGVLAAVTVLGMGVPSSPALVVAAVVLGTAVFVLLAVVSTALTRTVELAQLTTLPVLMLSFVFSGLVFPLAGMPEPVRSVAQALPLSPVVDLLRLGLTGTAPGGGHVGLAAAFGAAAVPVLVLAAWVAAGGWAARRWFRWEPRH